MHAIRVTSERQDKREPFFSSFIDAIEASRKKTLEWFNKEVGTANEETSIPESLFPSEDYSDHKSPRAPKQTFGF